MRRCLLLSLMLLSLAVEGRAAGDRIWSALVLATNETPANVPEPLADFAPVIQDVFGYNTLYLLGQKKRDLVKGGAEWLVCSREFFFKVQCLSSETTHYNLRIELYRDKKLLVTTDVKLAKDAPLYVRGPQWGQGQLIFVFEVQ